MTLSQDLNYPSEEYFVTTEDGYILRLFRLQAKGTQIKKGLKPVFMQHGLFDNSDTFISNEETISLAFAIANELNRDVWFGNNRGNKYSRNHTSIDVESREFWTFSYDEFAEKDLPAMLSYVSKETGFESFDYIGHSQGTTQMFAALSQKVPEVQKIVKRFFALGPIVYIYEMSSPMGKLALDSNFLQISLNSGVNQLLPYTNLVYHISSIACKYFSSICQYLISEIADKHGYKYDNTKYLHNILSYEPSGSSVMQIIHYQQNFKTGNSSFPVFAKFDFGEEKNLVKYHQTNPPEYDVGQIDKEVFMYQGLDDLMSTIGDVNLLQRKLKTKNNLKRYNDMGHVTYMWSSFTN